MKKFLCVLLALVLILSLVACGGDGTSTKLTEESESTKEHTDTVETDGKSQESILIGAIYPLTGSVAAIGQNCKNGIDLAVKEINEAGGVEGIPLEVKWGDSTGDPKVGMSEAERLITQENVVALVGCYQSSVTEVVAQVAEQYKVPFVSAISSSTALTTRGHEYFYRLALNNWSNAENMLKFAQAASEKMGLNFKKFAVFTDNSILGQELVESMRDLASSYDFELVAEVIHNSDSSDLSPEIMQLQNLDIDFICADQYVADAILVTNTMKELNYKPAMFISKATGYIDPSYLENVGESANGMITLTEFTYDSPRGIEVNKRFNEAFGTNMNGHSCMTYTAMWLYKNICMLALEENGEITREGVHKQLSECYFDNATFPDGTEFIIPYDIITFESYEMNGVEHTNMNPYATPTFVQIQDEKYVSVWPWDVANADVDYPATYE